MPSITSCLLKPDQAIAEPEVWDATRRRNPTVGKMAIAATQNRAITSTDGDSDPSDVLISGNVEPQMTLDSTRMQMLHCRAVTFGITYSKSPNYLQKRCNALTPNPYI
ncbi:MAG: hypothetical protein Fur0046_18340 [Cyanobacteria bacterium J069]